MNWVTASKFWTPGATEVVVAAAEELVEVVDVVSFVDVVVGVVCVVWEVLVCALVDVEVGGTHVVVGVVWWVVVCLVVCLVVVFSSSPPPPLPSLYDQVMSNSPTLRSLKCLNNPSLISNEP